MLPQNLEQRDTTPHAIRDQDIRALLACDLGLFPLRWPRTGLGDGGRVHVRQVRRRSVRAGALGFPATAVIRPECGDPWNLIEQLFSRARPKRSYSTRWRFTQARLWSRRPLPSSEPAPPDTLENNRSGEAGMAMLARTADAVIQGFDEALKLPAVLPETMRETVYHWLALMPGFRAADGVGPADLRELCAAKQRKGLL